MVEDIRLSMLTINGFILMINSLLTIRDLANGVGGCRLKMGMMLAWDTLREQYQLAAAMERGHLMLFNIYCNNLK